MRFPARARRFPVDRQVQAHRQASARPGGREAPAGGGAGVGRGFWAPGWPGISVALWPGRWPLPGCASCAQAEKFPAFRSSSPCDRHFFSTLLSQAQTSLIRLFSARSTRSLVTSARCRMRDLFWRTDAQMERLKPFFPVSHGRPRVDNRPVLRGIVFMRCNGCIAA